MIYENGTLKRILTDGGYIEGGAYYFYVKDHEGNNRVVADAGGTAVQSTHYYPFGMSYAEGNATSNQPYRYNGKELDTERGLNWYDYGARFYDPAMARWTTQDPLAEKYYGMSPYVYCANDPVNRIDPNGREWKENKDKEIATQLQEQIARRDKSLAKQEQKITAQIDKIGNNTKLSTEKKDQQIEKQQGKLQDVKTQRAQLFNLNEGIKQLGKSKTSYTFNTVEAGTTAALSSMSDGTVIVNNYGTTGNRAHETTHGIPFTAITKMLFLG